VRASLKRRVRASLKEGCVRHLKEGCVRHLKEGCVRHLKMSGIFSIRFHLALSKTMALAINTKLQQVEHQNSLLNYIIF
jgi:hypothetical protein